MTGSIPHGSMAWTRFTDPSDVPEWVAAAYIESYRGPHSDSLGVDDSEADSAGRAAAAAVVTPAVLAAHARLARERPGAATRVAVYAADDPAGFGPALQMITEHGGMLMDSVAVLLHRLGVAYLGIMTPVFTVQRDAAGELSSVEPNSAGLSGGSSLASPGTEAGAETWIHVQLSPSVSHGTLTEIEQLLPHVMADVRQVAADSTAMREALDALAAEVEADAHGHYDAPDRNEVAKLLHWLADGHFVLLGYQRGVVQDGRVLVEDADRMGVLRVRASLRPRLTGDKLLTLAQATVPSYMRFGSRTYVVVIREDTGESIVAHRFVGLFTAGAMNADVFEIPVISHTVREALALAESEPGHPGQLLLDIIQTVPRSELFAVDAAQLLKMAMAVSDLGSRRGALLFLRGDRTGRFVSCLVYLPRDRYTTPVRLQMEDILVGEFAGTGVEYSARVSEAPWALVHFMVRLSDEPQARTVDVSEANRVRIQGRLTEATRTWADRMVGLADGALTEAQAQHYAGAFAETYKQAVTPAEAVDDIAIIEQLSDDSVKLVFTHYGEADGSQLAWFLGGHGASLSQLLPMLQCMGVAVLDERPFTVTRADGLLVWIYKFRVSAHPSIDIPETGAERDAAEQRFADGVTAIWEGRVEVDRFNELVLRAGLTWQQVVVLRGYAKYLRQARFPYSESHIASVLNEHPGTARALVELFEALFVPSRPAGGRDAQAAAAAVSAGIDAVVSLDTDRVLRAFASLIQATIRTNYFITRPDSARAQNILAFKLEARLIDELPLPRPKFEIFVYSPRVEGVHLRFGFVSRGGLRWSDRREDFRTEILGLVKAQDVKNAVIVPVGAKGGFVVKNPPLPTGDAALDRDATRTEGVACYRLFISGLLEITDNVDHATGAISTPAQVVRRDGDDAYLVVAADKGTASFSDIANDVAKSYGFWLGDAFASGGSVGYDHKEMGITAKGAWEAVKRHFREMGVNTQTEEFTVVGVGDMSGDVFGNGMLRSRHIRLLAAFDHRHIFLDPDPDPAHSFAERQRMFDLPRSSWDDYDKSLISEGGGIYPRDLKSVPVSPQVVAVLGLDEGTTELTPPALIRAILRAPVDLLFNGGIGTYVKAETESDADVGDRANDQVRVNGNQVRAKVIGEGGNLGVTPLGRVEFDLAGGRINTDAMDNSAGVDCSDHEVNIKILIDSLVTFGKVDPADRAQLLASMTDEVSALVLEDNAAQNDLMGTSRANAASLLPVHVEQIRHLVADRGLNRELEALPSEKEIIRRADAGLGLASPELATLMAHVKLTLKAEVLATDLPDQEVFAARLAQYFPSALQQRFADEIRSHQLRREIVATMLINDVVDTAGITYAYRITVDAGVDLIDAVRAYVATDAIFGVGELWRRIRAAGECDGLPAAVTDRMTLDLRRLIDRAGRWLLNYRPQPLAVGAEINRFAEQVRLLTPRMAEWLRGADADIVAKHVGEFRAQGVPEDLAADVAVGLYRYSLLDIIDIADIAERDAAEVADTYFALMDRLGTDGLLTAVAELPRADRWHALARLAIRDDIYNSVRTLCRDVLAVGEPDEDGVQKIAEWESTNGSRVERARRTLTQIYDSEQRDLATLSVAARQIRSMTHASGQVSVS
ncbi:NAD-glutamate dehydrogenase [[Mycobacterium] zoologicum]|uniref:NAD-glutamate dehydrogenase n=1 Tax=[Mycobacterium] zoologicum TaxID=2872311 RepID=UPI001CDA67BB|nr:NAD-glutamate dehydrogenase [Mycolicibacter sp. MYC101]MEB3061717.1 NAD-glutamate dehydrogenase [Mycolicibacter sp. MYC101]